MWLTQKKKIRTENKEKCFAMLSRWNAVYWTNLKFLRFFVLFYKTFSYRQVYFRFVLSCVYFSVWVEFFIIWDNFGFVFLSLKSHVKKSLDEKNLWKKEMNSNEENGYFRVIWNFVKSFIDNWLPFERITKFLYTKMRRNDLKTVEQENINHLIVGGGAANFLIKLLFILE